MVLFLIDYVKKYVLKESIFFDFNSIKRFMNDS